MKANELRIGNWVNEVLIQSNKPFKNQTEVTYLDIKECHEYEHSYTPIPLTEEWLLKFGFEKVSTSFFKGLEIFEDDGNFFYGLRDEGQMDLHLEYVHQFQNWYYALKQIELTIKD